MKFLISFILSSNIITVFTVVSVDSNGVDYYRHVVKYVYDKNRSDGVIIMLARNYPSFEKITMWHEEVRMLSDAGISTLILNFSQFENRLEIEIERNYHPLIVINFETIEALHSFESIAKNLNMDYAVWLIFFSRDADQDVCAFCRNPHGNFFNLKFGSKMLISCCDSYMIEEWWSNEKNGTTRQEVGRLTNGDLGIVWFSDKLLRGRRYSMDGRGLRIAVLKGPKENFQEIDGHYYGFLGEILRELSQAMNFTVSKIIWDNHSGIWDLRSLKWTGIVGMVHRHEADIGVSNFIMTTERSDAVHFTAPVALGVYRLYFKKLETACLPWNAHFKVLTAGVWMVIIGFILTTPILLTLIKYKKRKYRKRKKFFSLLYKHYSYVWGIYCQQGLPDVSRESPLRIIYVSLSISAMVISGMYSASIISSLSVSSSYSPFDTMEQFLEDGTYTLTAVKNSIYYDMFKCSNQLLVKKMMALMQPEDSLPPTYNRAFEQVCSDRVAFYMPEIVQRSLVHLIPCELASIRTGEMANVAMILPRDSEYKDLVNYHIEQFRSNGILQRLEHKYYMDSQGDKLDQPVVHLQQIIPLVFALAIGFSIAFIIFIIERNDLRCMKKLRPMKRWKTRKIGQLRTRIVYPGE